MENYYSVTAQFGHVGRENCILKTVSTKAATASEAAYKVRWMPRVKHHRKDAIVEVKKISFDEYVEINKTNKQDPYFLVTSRQEQRTLCGDLSGQIINLTINNKIDKKERHNKIKYKMRKEKLLTNSALREMRNYEVMA